MRGSLDRVLDKLDRLLGKELAPAEPEAKTSDESAAQVKALADAMGEIRKLLQRTGAGFAAGAAALLAGLGYTQLHQVFPLPATHRGLVGAVALWGVALALFAAIVFAGRFFSAQRRILITTGDADDDISGKDAEIRRRMFEDTANEENARSLRALELRALRLERIARATTDDKERGRLEAEAARLTAACRLAMTRAAARILERRARDAFKTSRYWALFTVLGIIAAFAAADYSKGERDRVTLLKDCQAAVAAGAEDACDSVRSGKATQAAEDTAAKKAKAEEQALATARETFRKETGTTLDRVEACSRVLLAAPGLAGAGDEARAAVVAACVQLSGG